MAKEGGGAVDDAFVVVVALAVFEEGSGIMLDVLLVVVLCVIFIGVAMIFCVCRSLDDKVVLGALSIDGGIDVVGVTVLLISFCCRRGGGRLVGGVGFIP